MLHPDLSPIRTTSMNDIEELQEEAIAVGWDIRYTQHEAGGLDGTLTELRLPGLMVAREIYSRRARAYLDDNQERAVSRAELCQVTGASARTINAAFQDHYGVTPQVYHRYRRLSAVHRIFKHHWPDEITIMGVAFDLGFWHLGRFSRAYKSRFDELPSETLARGPPVLGPMYRHPQEDSS